MTKVTVKAKAITEEMLEGFKAEVETFRTRTEAESFLKSLTVKELKALYKYLYIYTYGEWYRMRKAEFIDEIIEYYFAPECEESTEETSEVTEEAKAALETWTDEDFYNYFPDGEITEDDIIELTCDELDSLNDYLKRKRESEELKTANEVQRVMDAITAVNYEPKATREILKAQTFNFQQAMLQIMNAGYGSMFDENLRIKELARHVKGVEDSETRQEYIKNVAMCIKLGRKNIEFFRNNERFQEYIPMHEEWQKYYQEWQEYLESYESKKELSA